MRTLSALVLLVLCGLFWGNGAAIQTRSDTDRVLEFDDFPLEEPLSHPDWFKKSFLDLREDLAEAGQAGKQGLILYFGQKHCAYCKRLLEVNFGLDDIRAYTQKHFEVVAIDIWGTEAVKDLRGQNLSERELAIRERTNFTPSLVFYDLDGREALRLRGYYPPYQFRAALEYVADGHFRRESFTEYLERGDPTLTFEPGDLHEQDFFLGPPFNLDRSRLPGERPMVVFFEQGNCHACDVLHSQPLKDAAIHRLLERFDSYQLDIWSDTPVITPTGRRSTAKDWAKELGLFYTPSILFFDEQGKEVIRVDSVVRFYRLHNVLNYVTSRSYLTEPNYQVWRRFTPTQADIGLDTGRHDSVDPWGRR